MLAYDLRLALKSLARRPGLSLAILLILALGIGSTTTIVSIVSSALLSRLPYPQGERLVGIMTRVDQDGSIFPASYLDVESWRQQSRILELVSMSSETQQLNLSADHHAERVGVGFVSSSYLDLLGARPILGRTFQPADDNRVSPPAIAVLRDGLWKRSFGGDPRIVGRTLEVQGLALQVIGVLPASFQDLYPDIDMYVPVALSRRTLREGYVEDRAVRWLDGFARLRPGATVEQADQELRAISRQLAATFPGTNKGYSSIVKPVRDLQFDFERIRFSILTLLFGATFVLLVGCANVTNLLLIRAVERRKEVALRLAMGVTRFRLVRLFVLEGALLSLGGAALGVVAAYAAVGAVAKLGTRAYNLPASIHFAVDLRALAVAVALVLLISLLIGVIPARRSLRVDLQEELQADGKGHSASADTAFTRSLLVVLAVLFSVVLLIGTGLMIRSLTELIRDDPGYRVDRVLSAYFELPTSQYRTDEPVFELYRQILARARTLPGVEDAGLWAPGILGGNFFYQFIVPEGKSLTAPEDKIKIYEHRVSPHLLQSMGIAFLKGRDFTEQDDARRPQIAILSRSTAEAAWPNQDPIGKRFWIGAPHKVWAEVVGVVADVEQRGRLQIDHDFRRDVYFPLYQMRSRTSAILLRTRGDGGQTALQLAEAMRSVAPDVPVFDVKTLRERRRVEEAGVRLNTLLLIFFAASALLLSIVGIYSILVYTVRQQSFATGIRMALGADQSNILRHFVGKGAALLAIGLLLGLAFSLGLAKAMASLLFNVSPYDPLVFVLGPLLIALSALPAILRPAYRATKSDPSSLFRLN
jgi:putative ABC transport system permease protein